MKPTVRSLLNVFKNALYDLDGNAHRFLGSKSRSLRHPLWYPVIKWRFIDVITAYGVLAIAYLLLLAKYTLYIIFNALVTIWLFKSFFERLPENVYEHFAAGIATHFLIIFCVAVIGWIFQPVPVKDVTIKPTRQ